MVLATTGLETRGLRAGTAHVFERNNRRRATTQEATVADPIHCLNLQLTPINDIVFIRTQVEIPADCRLTVAAVAVPHLVEEDSWATLESFTGPMQPQTFECSLPMAVFTAGITNIMATIDNGQAAYSEALLTISHPADLFTRLWQRNLGKQVR